MRGQFLERRAKTRTIVSNLRKESLWMKRAGLERISNRYQFDIFSDNHADWTKSYK